MCRWRISSASSIVVPTGTVTRFREVISADTGCVASSSKRRSRFVRIPTRTPSPSTIGTPDTRYSRMSSSARATGASGASVTGSEIIPASERLTLSTCATWSAIERLRWTIPSPPARASWIASRASVTVSIAAETIGIASSMLRVTRVRVETSLGRTCDSAGTSSTSSNVRPSFANFCSSERRRSSSARPTCSSVKDRRVTTAPARP